MMYYAVAMLVMAILTGLGAGYLLGSILSGGNK